jgi:hypothetical protein
MLKMLAISVFALVITGSVAKADPLADLGTALDSIVGSLGADLASIVGSLAPDL